jgi:hypothetical protein
MHHFVVGRRLIGGNPQVAMRDRAEVDERERQLIRPGGHRGERIRAGRVGDGHGRRPGLAAQFHRDAGKRATGFIGDPPAHLAGAGLGEAGRRGEHEREREHERGQADHLLIPLYEASELNETRKS